MTEVGAVAGKILDEITVDGHKSKNRLQAATESEARFRQIESGIDHTFSRLQAIEPTSSTPERREPTPCGSPRNPNVMRPRS